jgi:hypothetical protein
MSKRYVLYLSDSDLSKEDFDSIAELAKKYPGAKVIPVEHNPKAMILKTTNAVAPVLREGLLKIRGKTLKTVLTSGAIGNLKRRATGPADHGQVSQ